MAIIQAEVDILKSVEHPYIVRCFDAIDSPDKMYLVMEMCAAAPPAAALYRSQPGAVRLGSMKGGELFDRIVEKGHFTEADAAGVTAKLFSAIKCARRPFRPGGRAPLLHAVRHCDPQVPARQEHRASGPEAGELADG